MRRLCVLILGFLLLLGLTVSVRAAETKTDKGQIDVLLGKDISKAWMDYQFSDNFGLNGEFHDNGLLGISNTYTFRTGLFYRIPDVFRLNLGVRYDLIPQTTAPYGRLDFSLPFGDTLKICGYYDQNYYGNEWIRYEAALKIEAFKDQYIFAGVRGDAGTGAPIYDYNPEQEVALFLKGDFSWQTGKFDIAVQPILYIRGIWFHNYTVRYNLNQQMALVAQLYSDFYQRDYLQAGIQWKF